MAVTVALNQRLGGTNFLSVNGTPYLLVKLNSWSPATPERRTKAGEDGIHGFTETPTAGHIDADISDYNGSRVTAIGNLSIATVVASLANGKSITGQAVWNTKQPEVRGEDGTYNVRFEGGNFIEDGA